jgi:hypothetical protein
MTQTKAANLAVDEIRFLEYRLRVVSAWPPSRRRQITLEAVSRRLTDIARLTLHRTPGHDDLINLSCRLLDKLFSETPAEPCALAAQTPRA